MKEKAKISINDKIWKQKNLDEDYILKLSQSFGISDLLAKILSHKVESINEVENFLWPKIKNILPDPFHLLDMDKAVDRTIKALNKKEKICIFADYDVDGATSAALLKNVFRDLGHNIDVYVPDRVLEGYGLNNGAIDKIKAKGTDLIITVDCGTSSAESIEYAKKLQLDVIVIDHHLSLDVPASAIAVINPNRIDESSPYKYLAAVGVSFLFVVGLVKYLKENNSTDNQNMPQLMQYLDLVALGTVCDVMNIVGLNRAFVNAGLKILNQGKNIGIKALLEVSGLNEKVGPYHLGFVLGPRINAGGRIGSSELGASLLSAICEIRAKKIAIELNQYNQERRLIEEQMLSDALELAAAEKHSNCILIAQEGWHEGVIGIIAARIKEKFNKPVAVVAINNDICKASCRSIKNMDFGAKIINAKNLGLINSGGGHAMAAGFTTTKDKMLDLKDFLNEEFSKDFARTSDHKLEEYNLELTTASINLNLMEEINKLEPYGTGNMEPIFRFSNLFVLKADIIGGKHIRCLLAPTKAAYGYKALRAIVFNGVGSKFETALFDKYPNSMCFIGHLKLNNWQNSSYIQLHIKDIII